MTKPAPYPNRDEQETLAIDTFRGLVDHKQVKLDVRERDKYPNTDGYVEIVDEENRPVGKVEAQIKKLPDRLTPRLQCPLSLFAYATVTGNPVLLIGVDTDQKKAYWVHVLPDANQKQGQETILINFPVTQLIDGKNTRYITEWLQIAREYQKKLRDYNEKADAYARLSKIVNEAGGVAKAEFREIHRFLDLINSFLDGDFSLIKRRYYPNAWKVGFAYHEYSAISAGYTIFPISNEMNDLQIKEIDARLRDEFIALNGMFLYPSENPIKTRPTEHAIELLERFVQEILKYRLLEHGGSETIANEYLIAFVDRFHDQMGLPPKDRYSLAEIGEGFYHLSVWTDQAMRFLVREKRYAKPSDLAFGKPYIAPELLWSLVATDLKQIESSVNEVMASGGPIPIYPLGSEKLPFGIFAECESSLLSKGVTEIRRLYKPQDYSRLRESGGLKWATYSVSDLEQNLKVFFDKLPSTYADIIERNFPRLKGHLKLFSGATRVIAFFNARDQYESPQERPSIILCYLECAKERGLRIELHKKGQRADLEELFAQMHPGDMFELEGQSYTWTGGPTMGLDFIYEDLPMLTLIYQELEDAFRQYFTELKTA